MQTSFRPDCTVQSHVSCMRALQSAYNLMWVVLAADCAAQ